jgi:hypothetical protein
MYVFIFLFHGHVQFLLFENWNQIICLTKLCEVSFTFLF